MLKKLTIHNFKSFYNSTFEFGKLNCLIAPNNTGKSNLIEAIEFINNLLFNQIDPYSFGQNIKELKNYRYDEPNIYFSAEFELSNRVLVYYDLIEYKYNVVFNIVLGEMNNIDLEIDGHIKSIKIDTAHHKDIVVQAFGLRIYDDYLDSNKIENYEEYSQQIDSKKYSKFNFKYSSNTLSYQLESPSTVKNTIQNLLELKLNTKNELTKHIDFRNIFSKRIFSSHYFHSYLIKENPVESSPVILNKYGTNLVEFISGQLRGTIEDISTSLIGEVEQINSIKIVEAAYKTLFFVENGQYEVPLKKASDGTVHFLAIMSALIASDKSVMAMMFEEPERHMHMKVLSYILNTMRDSQSQIFLTTHSTELLSQLNLDEIIFMFRDYDGDTKGQRAKDVPNIHKFMKRYRNDLVEMIKMGILGEYEEDL
jgi:predicted ATPase